MRENIEKLRNLLKPESLFVSTLEKYREQTEADLNRAAAEDVHESELLGR